MKSPPSLFAFASALLLGVTALVVACGGATNTAAPDVSKIPTATLPATLPAPLILSSGAVQAGVSTYTVKSGDTLAGIAAHFGVALADLTDANPTINPSQLSVGQVVKLPAASTPPPDATPTGPAAITAVLPSTTAAAAITAALPTTTAAPATEPPATAAAPTQAPATATPGPAVTPPAGGTTYTVQAGDYPGTIAAKFGITTAALLAANPGIDPTNLQIGQVLIIPPKPAGG